MELLCGTFSYLDKAACFWLKEPRPPHVLTDGKCFVQRKKKSVLSSGLVEVLVEEGCERLTCHQPGESGLCWVGGGLLRRGCA